jgi:hypothetical protein
LLEGYLIVAGQIGCLQCVCLCVLPFFSVSPHFVGGAEKMVRTVG